MRIGELAAQTGLSTKTIRCYEPIGLVPDTERAANGYRVNDQRVVARIGFVIGRHRSPHQIASPDEARIGGAHQASRLSRSGGVHRPQQVPGHREAGYALALLASRVSHGGAPLHVALHRPPGRLEVVENRSHELMIIEPIEPGTMDMEAMDEMALYVMEEDDLSPNTTVEFDYTFAADDVGASLEFACYLTGHYEAGMHLPITVES